MENYHYLNQKTELPMNQDKSFLQFNKNLQFQNFFRGDSNMNKQKGKIYYLNNKKEIHFTTRAKENEITTNGPKMLTMNFPPGFMITDNNNNSRKNASHEKNIYLQQNMANNMELNDIGSENGKIFSITVKKGFQDFNESNSQDKKSIDILGQKQRVMSIKLNNNDNINNLQKKNNMSGSSGVVFNYIGNIEYDRSETEIKSGRGNSSNEKSKGKNYEIALSHIRTEGSDFDIHKNNTNEGNTKYKSDNIPFNIYINSHQYNKGISNMIYNSNFDSDNNNNYSSNNSNNSKDKLSKNSSYGQKDLHKGGGSSSTNKLVFNPSSITNQRMIKKGSDSELYPSSINHKYVANKKYNKEFKQLNNHLSYSNINESCNYYKKNNYHINKSENNSKLSPSQEKNSHSQSREKSHTKTQTDFEKNNRPNYYESLIYELNKLPDGNSSQLNINSVIGYNNNILENFDLNKKIKNLNIGIPYKLYYGYKFYFNIPNEQIYILKEVSYSQGKGIMSKIGEWNKKYGNEGIYLKIYDHEIDYNQKQIIWIIQYPTGGESLNDIINSVGFYDQNYLFDIVTKIYKSIIKLREDKNKNIEKYNNVPFCLCDIFINLNDHIKLIPPIIRQISINSINSYENKKIYSKNNNYFQCKCKTNILLLQMLFNINKDSISFFCLGFLIIQLITQNLIFDLNSYKYIFKKIKMNMNKINNSFTFKNINKNINITDKKCCLAHLLLDIEKQKLNGNEYLLFSHFLNLYPKCLLSFLHECTSFNNNIPSSSNEFLNLYDTNKNLNLSIKEILEITNLPKNEYIKFDVFLNDFGILYKDIRINNDDYIRKLNSNKVTHVLSRAFGMDKDKFLNYIGQKIQKSNYDNYINNNDINLYKEKLLYEDKKNNCDINLSSLFIGYNKKKDNGINSNNIFNKKNNRQMHNYHSSENYDLI